MDKEKKKKRNRKTIIAATTGASLLVGNTYDGVEDVLRNTEQDDDNRKVIHTIASADPLNLNWRDKVKNALSKLPVWLRGMVGIPLWLLGTFLTSSAKAVWAAVLSPIADKLMFWLAGFLFVALTVLITVKTVLPHTKLGKIIKSKVWIPMALVLSALPILDYVEELYPDQKIWFRIAQAGITAVTILVSVLHLYRKNHETKLVAYTDKYLVEN